MTLGTGAVGLNDLSVASRVHFLEPQWNPSIESQAVGRVLRLGQEKKCYIVRYVMKGSIEKVRQHSSSWPVTEGLFANLTLKHVAVRPRKANYQARASSSRRASFWT